MLLCDSALDFLSYAFSEKKRDHIRALSKGWGLSLGFGVRVSRSKAWLTDLRGTPHTNSLGTPTRDCTEAVRQ